MFLGWLRLVQLLPCEASVRGFDSKKKLPRLVRCEASITKNRAMKYMRNNCKGYLMMLLAASRSPIHATTGCRPLSNTCYWIYLLTYGNTGCVSNASLHHKPYYTHSNGKHFREETCTWCPKPDPAARFASTAVMLGHQHCGS
jgi:hypothetical protein